MNSTRGRKLQKLVYPCIAKNSKFMINPYMLSATPHHLQRVDSHNLTTPWRLLALMGARFQAHRLRSMPPIAKPLHRASPLPSKGKSGKWKADAEMG